MTSNLRCVFDANVLISALLTSASVPALGFAHALDHGVVLISQSLIGELSNVLSREKFRRYITSEEVERFLVALVQETEQVTITSSIKACRDSKDDRLLELAVDGKAVFLVTGDLDLLVLNPFRGVRIVNPANFLEHVTKHSNSSGS